MEANGIFEDRKIRWLFRVTRERRILGRVVNGCGIKLVKRRHPVNIDKLRAEHIMSKTLAKCFENL